MWQRELRRLGQVFQIKDPQRVSGRECGVFTFRADRLPSGAPLAACSLSVPGGRGIGANPAIYLPVQGSGPEPEIRALNSAARALAPWLPTCAHFSMARGGSAVTYTIVGGRGVTPGVTGQATPSGAGLLSGGHGIYIRRIPQCNIQVT